MLFINDLIYFDNQYPYSLKGLSFVGGVIRKNVKPSSVILYLPRDTVLSIPISSKFHFAQPTLSFDFNNALSSFDSLKTLEIYSLHSSAE